MPNVIIYTKNHCPYCNHAKALFESKKIAYTEIAVDNDADKLAEMISKSNGRRTVPQIFINDHAIGGFDDLSLLAKSGQLDNLLV